MACQEQAYNAYLAEQQATNDAFAEFGAMAESQPEFEFEVMPIWQEFAPILPLFDYVVLTPNHHNGYIMGVDWVAVDVLLRREEVTVSPADFANFRVAMTGYVNGVNDHITQNQKN